jgi:ribosome-associated protein
VTIFVVWKANHLPHRLFRIERKHLRTTTLKKDDIAPSTPDIGEAHAADRALELVRESLEDSKAEDIVSINIQGKSALADYMVIASGRSHRHVGAVADHLLRALKEAGYGTAKVEGLSSADWVLIDAGDVIVHVFRPEVRDFYALEKMWQEPEETPGTLH